MPTNTCWKCGSSYEGISCPVCVANTALEKQTGAVDAALGKQSEDLTLAMEETSRRNEEAAREVQAAVEASAARMQEAISGAAEQQRRNIADAWRLQAQAKTEKATELYKAKMYDEAIRMLLDAVSQDPSNLETYIVASWTYEAKGDQKEALAFYRKQIALLEAKPYRRDPRWATRILSGLPNWPELLTALSETAEGILLDFYFSEPPLEFIARLRTLSLKKTALLVTSAALNQSPSLGLFALHIDIVGASSQSEALALGEYLNAQPFERQPALLKEIEEFSAEKWGISKPTMTLMNNELRKWFQHWYHERTCRSLERVKTEAKAESNASSGPGIVAAILGFFSWVFTLAAEDSLSIPRGGIFFLFGFGVAGVVAFSTYYFIYQMGLSSITKRIEAAEAIAEAEWRQRVARVLD